MPVKQLIHCGDITFAPGARVAFPIPTYGPLLMLMLRVQYTITNGGSNAVGPKDETLARIIRRLEIQLQGRDNIWNVSGATIAAQAFQDTGLVAEGMDASVVLTSSAATTYTVTLPVYLCQSPRYAQRADDTAIDFRTGITGTLFLEFASADCSDFYTTPNGAALSAVTVEVSGIYEREADATRTYFLRTMDEILTELPASNTALSIGLDRGSGIMFRSFLLKTLADDAYVSTILGNKYIELAVGPTPIDKIRAGHLLTLNRMDMGVAQRTGLYRLDKSWFGSGLTMVPTKGLPTELVLKLDATKVSGVNKIVTVREGFIPQIVR